MPAIHSPSENDEDKRQHPRRYCSRSIFFSDSNRPYDGIIKNLSLGGIYVEAAATFITGQVLKVAIPINENSRGIKLKGKVIWLNQKGFGLAFNHRSRK